MYANASKLLGASWIVEKAIASLHDESMNPMTLFSIPILPSARSGLRSGEAYGLVWGDIDFDVKGKDGKLRIQQSAKAESLDTARNFDHRKWH
ncbi:MAG: hypothetical protein KF799_01175 [Bdellovibrionales bacterium]|nr:hypothetical protein [Bdellovibrionales bacterium]